MKYKLLKDTPTIKAGTIFEKVVRGVDGIKGLAVVVPIGADTDFQWTIKDIDNFDEWFEEMEEPTDSSNWEPKVDERYFYVNEYGDVEYETWDDDDVDNRLMAMGLVYRTEEECEEARERRLAEVRLRKTSTFKPDFKNERSGWVVCYDYRYNKLGLIEPLTQDFGEIVHYATKEDAKKSIRENREDWLIYFGIKEK
jgi:hypothetical protein